MKKATSSIRDATFGWDTRFEREALYLLYHDSMVFSQQTPSEQESPALVDNTPLSGSVSAVVIVQRVLSGAFRVILVEFSSGRVAKIKNASLCSLQTSGLFLAMYFVP